MALVEEKEIAAVTVKMVHGIPMTVLLCLGCLLQTSLIYLSLLRLSKVISQPLWLSHQFKFTSSHTMNDEHTMAPYLGS
jgi:hypothetical protein